MQNYSFDVGSFLKYFLIEFLIINVRPDLI